MYGGFITPEKIKISKEIKDYTYQQAKEDVNNLFKMNVTQDDLGKLVGNKYLDYYFFPYRLDTKTKRKISFYDFYDNKDKYINKKIYKKLKDYNMSNNNKMTEIDLLYHYFQLYYGSVNQFKPIISKYLYKKYKVNTVLDFASSWGGRLLGAMSIPNVKYIGVDINKDLKKPYEEMIEDLHVENRVKMIFKDAVDVDYSKLNYDFVFTSPPYFNKEITEHMPHYNSYSDYYDNYLEPVISETYKNLKKGGHYILVINDDLYEDIKNIIGEADEKYEHVLSKRKYTGKDYNEYIYVWSK